MVSETTKVIGEVDGLSAARKPSEEGQDFYAPNLGLNIHAYIAAEQKQGIHHLGRYVWAIPVVSDRARILDIG